MCSVFPFGVAYCFRGFIFNTMFLGSLEPWQLVSKTRGLQFYLLGVTQVNIPPSAGFLSTVQISYPSSCNYSEMHMNANSCLSLGNAVLILGRACWQYILNNFGGMKIHFRQILHGRYASLLKVNLCGASPVISWIGSTEIFEVECVCFTYGFSVTQIIAY